MTTMIRLAISALGFSIAASTVATAQDGSPRDGLALARRNCAECHAVTKDEQRSPHVDAPTFSKIAATPGMTSISLTVALTTSHKTMPNIVLSTDERRDVIAYILSLRTP
jgi:mono/diheme cytochrome c family protein